MSNIKYIDYDCSEVDNVLFDRRIETLTSSFYRIDKRSLMVNYIGTAKDLYNNLEDLVKEKYVLIIDVSNTQFYGYHKSALWKWINTQFEMDKNK